MQIIQWLDDPDDYSGEPSVAVELTFAEQTSAQQRRSLQRWIDFFSTARPIERLELRSRVPQPVIDALAGQRELRELHVKFGPFTDLAPLTGLPRLAALEFSGARKLRDLSPLIAMPALSRLRLDNPDPDVDIAPLSELRSLRALSFGNGYPGSSTSLTLPGVSWVAPLLSLEQLELPGTRLLDPDLTPLLRLPRLRQLVLPLRRAYRKQVTELAAASELFASVLRDYLDYDEFVAANR